MPKFLKVGVECFLRLLLEYASGDPVVQVRGRPGVDIVQVTVGRLSFSLDDAGEVVGAGFVIALLHLGRDLVVRLRDEILRRTGLGSVAIGAKRKDLGHELFI